MLAGEGIRGGSVTHSLSFYYGACVFMGSRIPGGFFCLNFLNYEIENLEMVSDYQKEEWDILPLLRLGGTIVSVGRNFLGCKIGFILRTQGCWHPLVLMCA